MDVGGLVRSPDLTVRGSDLDFVVMAAIGLESQRTLFI